MKQQAIWGDGREPPVKRQVRVLDSALHDVIPQKELGINAFQLHLHGKKSLVGGSEDGELHVRCGGIRSK